MPTKLKNLEVTSVDFVDAGANPGAKISIFKKADDEKNSSENVISKLAKSIGVTEKDFTDALVSSLTAAVEKFSKAEDEINQPAVNDDDEEENSEPIKDNPDDDPTKKVDEEFAKSEENQMEENSMNENDLRKKLDAVQLAAIESIEKSYGVHIHLEPTGAIDAAAGNEIPTEPTPPIVEEKSVEKSSDVEKSEETADLTKALAQVVKNLQVKVEKAEDKEFVELAKKYEILGLKAEELAPMLKQAKRTAPALYETSIAVMDGAVAAIEPMFSEVGKRGSGFAGDAQTQVEKMASEIRKKNPDISYHQSIDKVFQENPDLRAALDN